MGGGDGCGCGGGPDDERVDGKQECKKAWRTWFATAATGASLPGRLLVGLLLLLLLLPVA